MDQTRTVGAGGFVGMLLSGGTPVQTGAGQLLVLLAVQTVALVVTSSWCAAARSAGATAGAGRSSWRRPNRGPGRALDDG